MMRWLAILAGALVLNGCGLVTQSSDGASIGAPTSSEDVRAIPITSTTSTRPGEISTTTPVTTFEGERLPMNISDSYVIGRPGQEQCDAAFVMVTRGFDLARLEVGDPIEEYVSALESSIGPGEYMLSISTSPTLTAQAAGSLEYFQSLIDFANSGATVAEMRSAINEWATKDGVNAGTWLLGVQQECPDIVQGVVVPETVFGPAS